MRAGVLSEKSLLEKAVDILKSSVLTFRQEWSPREEKAWEMP